MVIVLYLDEHVYSAFIISFENVYSSFHVGQIFFFCGLALNS